MLEYFCSNPHCRNHVQVYPETKTIDRLGEHSNDSPLLSVVHINRKQINIDERVFICEECINTCNYWRQQWEQVKKRLTE